MEPPKLDEIFKSQAKITRPADKQTPLRRSSSVPLQLEDLKELEQTLGMNLDQISSNHTTKQPIMQVKISERMHQPLSQIVLAP